ncbi:alkene reductase [Oxalobacter sp. OttesenSCG-928-P03]|nr:alkene reductase [Oxalobacter sp. OttesenSCG-928-P03]
MKLLSSVQVGDVSLSNRVAMAPLTRSRAGRPGDVPTALNAEYYAQRATAGLIVSEGTQISRQGQGYAFTPGIYTDEQEAGWKKVVEAVHAKGGKMAAQLWHVGRMSHHSLQEEGQLPVAPSALAAQNSKCYIVNPDGSGAFAPVDTPRALETEEMAGIVEQYRQAAIRAMRAGFDFVEEHAANGYLLQQFMSPNSNIRTDRYGGSIENRARLTLEVMDALCETIGNARVGVRISPHFNINGIDDPESEAMALYLAKEFDRRNIAYLHIAEPSWVGGEPLTPELKRKIRDSFSGPIILCGGYTAQSAEQALKDGLCDLVAFGRLYIANSDLVERIRRGGPYNEPDRATFYQGGPKGYTDYPVLE